MSNNLHSILNNYMRELTESEDVVDNGDNDIASDPLKKTIDDQLTPRTILTKPTSSDVINVYDYVPVTGVDTGGDPDLPDSSYTKFRQLTNADSHSDPSSYQKALDWADQNKKLTAGIIGAALASGAGALYLRKRLRKQ